MPGQWRKVATDEPWVTVRAPKRIADEYWTMTVPQSGLLVCFSSLVGSPQLITANTSRAMELVVEIPKGRAAGLRLIVA